MQLSPLLLALLVLVATAQASPVTQSLTQDEQLQQARDQAAAQVQAAVPMTPEMQAFLDKYKNTQIPADMTPTASNQLVSSKKPASSAPSLWGSAPSRPTVSTQGVSLMNTFARYSAAAYCVNLFDLADWTCGANCQGGTAGTNDVTSVWKEPSAFKSLMAVNNNLKTIIVSFRGSLEPQNFVADIRLNLVDGPSRLPNLPSGAKVHAGFWDTWANGKSEVVSYVKSARSRYPGFRVVTTGHSLGGAMAVLAALDLRRTLSIPDSQLAVYTYGEPRVGNPTFASYVSNQAFEISRFVHEDDVVPHIPLRSWGYAHHRGENYEINSKVYQCTTTGSNEADDCSNSRVPTINIVSHLMAMDVVFGPWC
ncbi:hypothetical protein GGF32_009482 [Allomyces javanicus]|nr:hypothetical protein GGF32_009482 [Allomyces javanicus]